MSKYLITASLINSYQYYINDKWKSPADSRADFLKTLSREKFEPNEAMQKGIDFEKDIELATNKLNQIDILHEDYDERQHIVNQIAKIVKGGIWQATCKKDISIKDKDFILYGRCDVIKANTIYDIKYTGKYELGKFQNSIQHLIYLYCLDLPKFSYLVSNGKEWWEESYDNNSSVGKIIKSKISDFLGYLENDKEASDIFYQKWVSKY